MILLKAIGLAIITVILFTLGIPVILFGLLVAIFYVILKNEKAPN